MRKVKEGKGFWIYRVCYVLVPFEFGSYPLDGFFSGGEIGNGCAWRVERKGKWGIKDHL